MPTLGGAFELPSCHGAYFPAFCSSKQAWAGLEGTGVLARRFPTRKSPTQPCACASAKAARFNITFQLAVNLPRLLILHAGDYEYAN